MNKHQESFRSPFSNTFYPEPINNYYISPRMLNYEKKINRALEEFTFLNYLYGTSSVFSYESENSLTTVFFIKKDIEEDKFGIKGGFLNFRVTISCEFKDQNKKSAHVNASIESYCLFSLNFKNGEKEKSSISGIIDESVKLKKYKYLK